MLVAKIKNWPVRKGSIEPTVSVILSVWNEEDVVEAKLKNLLSLGYPKEKFDILIGSDGSSDRTSEIIKSFSDERISFVESNSRRGKMAMINELVKKSDSEIIMFTDARQTFEGNVVRELVANFADPKVGCVSGELVFSKKEGGTAKGVNLYWNYEKFIRSQESKIHSMLGATGAICAIRKELFTKIPEEVVLDDVFVPFNLIKKGYRAVFDASAKAYDEVADSPKEEYSRKARTIFGNYQIFGMMPGMFNPLKSPVAIQLFSHKLLRLLVPFFMILLFLINLALIGDSFFRFVLALQVLFYVMAFLGALSRYKNYGTLKVLSRTCYVPYVFCLLNFSALVGFLRFIRGGQKIEWEKARSVREL